MCYIYNYTRLVENQFMDQFDGDYGIEQKATLKLVNIKYQLPLHTRPCSREDKRMAKEFVYYASIIYAALLNMSKLAY